MFDERGADSHDVGRLPCLPVVHAYRLIRRVMARVLGGLWERLFLSLTTAAVIMLARLFLLAPAAKLSCNRSFLHILNTAESAMPPRRRRHRSPLLRHTAGQRACCSLRRRRPPRLLQVRPEG